LRSYDTARKDFEAVTGIDADRADIVSIATWQASMEARGLSGNTIRARLSAVSILSGVKVQLPKKATKKDIAILSDDQLKAFFRQIVKDSDHELLVQILLTGRRPKAPFHWLSSPRLSFTSQEITRKIKRYARLAGLNEEQVNMRTLVRTGKDLISKHDANYIVQHILPKPAKQTVEWKPLHGIGQRKLTHLLVEEALTQKEMALRLDREMVTIKRHFRQIGEQMGVGSMYQVVAVAVERGWVKVPKLEEAQRGEKSVG
jgi:hypothetical protein